MSTELNTALQGILATLAQLAQTLLLAALPILAAYGIRWLRVQGKIAWAKLEATQNRSLIALVETLASMAVRAAEMELGPKKGEFKKPRAVKLLSDWLEARGVQLDEDKIFAAVEAAVWTEVNAPTTSLLASTAEPSET